MCGIIDIFAGSLVGERADKTNQRMNNAPMIWPVEIVVCSISGILFEYER